MKKIFLIFLLLNASCVNAAGFALNFDGGPQGVSQGVQILILLTILSVAPSILLMSTSFVRFIIVFGMLRQAIGLGQLPPTQVLIGLSLILTFVVMQPTFNRINEEALQPFVTNKINEQEFFDKGFMPLKEFMSHNTGTDEMAMVIKLAKVDKPKTLQEMPNHLMMAAFMLSELKKAFQIGFMIFLPFIIIDMVVASALVSIGLMFLPPTTIALPFKVVLFVLINGWAILSQGLVLGFK
jgi:flagellar biosynthesis protein FliP